MGCLDPASVVVVRGTKVVSPSLTVNVWLLAAALVVPRPIVVGRFGGDSVASRIPPPRGFRRLCASPGSFAAWLGGLPLRPGRPDVLLYDGQRKRNQETHYAVLDVDVGPGDLQQCADAVIRLRAEFLYAGPCRDDIHFNFTSGDTARWVSWRNGMRPRLRGNHVSWFREAAPDSSYQSFRRYLDVVFSYAGTASLSRELRPAPDPARPEQGDVFIHGGSPGHAAIVIDVAQDDSGDRVFLLAQGYMPAQDIHILKSFDDTNPWYRARPLGTLQTPEWEFSFRELKRFQPLHCETAGTARPD
jgi:hypothetical protein